jgi:hypothetical protein
MWIGQYFLCYSIVMVRLDKAIAEGFADIKAVLEQLVQSINKSEDRQRQQRNEPVQVNAIVRQPETIEGENAANQHKAQRTQNAIAVAAWAAFVAALAYAVIAQLTLNEIHQQTAEVYTQAEVENANASGQNAQLFRQLNIAQQQAKAAQDSANATSAQMRQDQRAWVYISLENPRMVADEPYRVSWVLIDTGKTPAKHMDGHAMVEIVTIGQSPHFNYDRYPSAHFDAALMVPNAPLSPFGFQTLRFKPNTKDTEPINLSATDIAEINNGQAYIAIHGIVKYRDIFKTAHWIKFCSYQGNLLKVQGYIKACINYNDTDDD